MEDVLKFVSENWALIIAALYALGNLIVALIPGEEDDAAWKRFLQRIAILAPPNSLGTLKLPGAQAEQLDEEGNGVYSVRPPSE